MMFSSFTVMIFSVYTELQWDIFDIQPSLIGFGAHTPVRESSFYLKQYIRYMKNERTPCISSDANSQIK